MTLKGWTRSDLSCSFWRISTGNWGKSLSGLKHPPRERMSPKSFILSIASPALICQVDEHTLDLLVIQVEFRRLDSAPSEKRFEYR
jgi:hypothetical protein